MKIITCDICRKGMGVTLHFSRMCGRNDHYTDAFMAQQRDQFDICNQCDSDIREVMDKKIEEIKSRS